jgi:prepilin peptidase CpaA
MILFLVVFGMLVAIGFLVAAAISDFRTMTIPNIYAGGIALAFFPAFFSDMFTGAGMEFFGGWQSHAIGFVAIFAVTFVLFSLRVIGAGDSKLASAVALWVGLSGMASFLFYMAIVGALLGLATKLMNSKVLVAAPKEGGWIAQSQAGRLGVPYGIAICVGAIVAFYQLGYFSPEKLALLAGYTENQP